MFTDRLYTGQRELTGLGLYNYNARFYSPKLGRFIQPDTIVPGAGNPQAYNRYSYVLNNPIKFNDPSGHMQVEYYQGAYLSISQMNKLFSTQRSSTTSKTPTVTPTAPKTSTPTSSAPASTGQTSTTSFTPVQQTVLSSGSTGKGNYGSSSNGNGNNQWGYCTTRNLVDGLNCGAMLTQDIATLIDLVGAGVEFAMIGTGCFVGPEGCAGGVLAGEAAFVPLNGAEMLFSGISLGFTFFADRFDDGKIGYATDTSVITFLSGTAMWDPIGDLIIDGYASGYNHGLFTDFNALMNGEGLIRKDWRSTFR